MSEYKTPKLRIEEFLEEFRSLSRPRVDIEPRSDYIQFLVSKNLVEEDAYDVILNKLNYTHYMAGPEDDYDNKKPGQVWKFKIKNFGTTVYIKLKLYKGKFGLSAKCLSFHDNKK